MILLDTNVISELSRNDPVVRAWLIQQDVSALRISVTSLTEVVFGLERLPRGKRHTQLFQQWLAFENVWSDRILPVTAAIAHMAGVATATRATAGAPISFADAQIAATALVYQSPLATRNTQDFKGLGLELVNPWQ